MVLTNLAKSIILHVLLPLAMKTMQQCKSNVVICEAVEPPGLRMIQPMLVSKLFVGDTTLVLVKSK